MSNPFDADALELLAAKSDSQPSEPVDGDRLLHDISGFIARFLYCSAHQRTVLALWVLHTYCYSAAQVTPYLSIQSAQKQSGKTLCLQLLQLLCDFPTLTAGFTASSLLRSMRGTATDTLLLDECQTGVGTRVRPKAPTLRAILIRGTHPDPDHLTITRDRRTFCPKAFAGRGNLPEDLADRSLPIILPSLDSCVAQHSGSPARAGFDVARDGVEVPTAASSLSTNLPAPAGPSIERFHLRWATEAAKPLRKQLHDWSSQNTARLLEMPPYGEEDFPPNLSCRQQDLAEPLLYLADLIGGEWPARIREALIGLFEEQTTFELQPAFQLLADIRDCFAHHDYPLRLPTSVVLDWMHTLPSRPWDIDGRFSAHTLARLLAPFKIRPRNQRIGKEGPKRGYQLENFKEPWLKHFGFTTPESNRAHQNSEINSNHAPCNIVSLAGEFLVPGQEDVAQRGNLQENSTVLQPPSAALLSGLSQDRRETEAISNIVAQPLGSPARASVACGGLEVSSAAPAVGELDQNSTPRNVELAQVSRIPEAQKSQIVNNTCPRDELASRKDGPCNAVASAAALAEQPEKTQGGNTASPASPDLPVAEPNIAGFHRLTFLHRELRLQGLCPPLDNLANMYPHDSFQAALNWVEAHPEWSARFKYKPAMEFVAAFQNGPVRLYLHDSRYPPVF